MKKNSGPNSLSRREFLRAAGLLGAVAVGSGSLASLSTSCNNTSSATAYTSNQNATNSSKPHFAEVMDDGNSLIVHAQGAVAKPGKVTVQYWAPGASPLITAPVATTGNTFSVAIMRLQPSTQYNFQVFLAEGSKAPVFQHQGTFLTGPLPPGLKDAKIEIIQGVPTYDLLLLDFNCYDFNGIVAIDKGAKIVWYYQNDNSVFALDQDKKSFGIVFNELSQGVGYSMKHIQPDGRVLHSVDDRLTNGSICKPNGRWNHEIHFRPNNKVWTLGAEVRTVNIKGTDTMQSGNTIEEWDLNKNTVTRLVNMFDILDPVNDRRVDSDTTQGFYWAGSQNQYLGIAQDWTHSNSLDIMADGTVLISHRHLDQVTAIRPDFSGVVWRLGGPRSDFNFPNPSDQFYHQHYAEMLANGHILLFDNGNGRPSAEGGEYSRALELELNFSTKQATKVWEYRHQPDLFSSAVGSAIRMANGNTIADFGVDLNWFFTVVEADPTGKAVAVIKISAPGKPIQYRAIPIDSLNGEKAGLPT